MYWNISLIFFQQIVYVEDMPFILCCATFIGLFRSDADTVVLWMTKVIIRQTYAKELC
jgi:hypothetical protein